MIRIALQMDELAQINFATDTTFLLALEAKSRGFDVFHYTVKDLFLHNDKAFAKGRYVDFLDNKPYYNIQNDMVVSLDNFDVILMRQDPPFDLFYITATYILDFTTALVINNPAAVRSNNEKIFASRLAKFMPDTIVTKDKDKIKEFLTKHKTIVMKSLFKSGGEGIFVINHDDRNCNSILDTVLRYENSFIMIQQYLPNISQGDKRVIFIDGEPCGSFSRFSADDDVRANGRQGGSAKASSIAENERQLCLAVSDLLLELDIFFAGIDIIDSKLIEINITSPTGFAQIRQLSNIDLAKIFWDKLDMRMKR